MLDVTQAVIILGDLEVLLVIFEFGFFEFLRFHVDDGILLGIHEIVLIAIDHLLFRTFQNDANGLVLVLLRMQIVGNLSVIDYRRELSRMFVDSLEREICHSLLLVQDECGLLALGQIGEIRLKQRRDHRSFVLLQQQFDVRRDHGDAIVEAVDGTSEGDITNEEIVTEHAVSVGYRRATGEPILRRQIAITLEEFGV